MNRIEFYMKLDNYKAKQKAKEEEKNKGEVLMHYGTISNLDMEGLNYKDITQTDCDKLKK